MKNIDLNEIENQINNFTLISRELDFINLKIIENSETTIKRVENRMYDNEIENQDISKKINLLEEKIIFNEKIIQNEKALRKYPSQAIGSVFFYNQFNNKFDLFVESQFNKLIRFLEHIENKEENYRKLYLECTDNYFKNPFYIPINDLQKSKKEIDAAYDLLHILSNEVNEDVVKFNKVYNKLEDIGLFMTIPEKTNQKYLNEISLKLDDVILGLKTIFQSLEEANRSLREIEGNSSEISSNTSEIAYELWGISQELKYFSLQSR